MTEIEDIVIALRKLQCKPNCHIWATAIATVKTMKSLDPKVDIEVTNIVHKIQYSGGDKICIASLKSVLQRGYMLKKGIGVVGGNAYKVHDVVLGIRPSECNFPGGMTCDARDCKIKQLVGLQQEYEVLTDEQKQRMGIGQKEGSEASQTQQRPSTQYFRYKGKLFKKKAPVIRPASAGPRKTTAASNVRYFRNKNGQLVKRTVKPAKKRR